MITFLSINNFTKHFIVAFLLFFLFVIIFNGGFGWHSNEYEDVDTSGEIILARLSRAMAELHALKAQNEELRNLIQNFAPLNSKPKFVESQLKLVSYQDSDHERDSTLSSVSDLEYELSRRKLKTDINELWNYIKQNVNQTSPFLKDLKNSLLYDIDTISRRNDHWRRNELEKLSNYVQERITKLQNPENCQSARKLVCNLNKGCGFGCQMHHLVYCMIVSMATSRTLVVNSKSWRYVGNRRMSNQKSLWELAFKPLSNSCLDDSGNPRGNWASGPNRDHNKVLDLPIIDSIRPRPNYLPLTIPEEISSKLITLHGAPIVWFIGQILKFLMKPSTEVEKYLNQKRKQFSFNSPIVGVHVRRTDKINTEASFHSLSEYMVHVSEFYDRLDLFNQRMNKKETVKRLVYLATDDISVWKKEIQKYEEKGYKFIGDYEISNTATVGRRYSFDSLKNIILDVWLLSETDYLVCTFSSQVCRLAYELMQSRVPHIDRHMDFFSLDDIYYFGGQSSHNQIALLDHQAQSSNEISMKIGDIIGIAGNHWNGYSKGVNRETKENGLFPGFKTAERIETAPFDLFQD